MVKIKDKEIHQLKVKLSVDLKAKKKTPSLAKGKKGIKMASKAKKPTIAKETDSLEVKKMAKKKNMAKALTQVPKETNGIKMASKRKAASETIEKASEMSKKLKGSKTASVKGSKVAKIKGSKVAKTKGSKVVKTKGSKVAKIKGSKIASIKSSKVAKIKGVKMANNIKGSTKAKKRSSTKFLALKKANDKQFHKKSMARRLAFKRGKEMVARKRGVMVLSNIPHGFFEGQMERYFRQFGVLENLRLVRSRRTGQSCGYAYVEFEHYEVAKIVAKYMDGYLTFGKIMKCKLLPPELVSNKLFRGKNIRPENCPKLSMRKGAINRLNKIRTDKQIKRRTARLLSIYTKKVAKLQELGVNLSLETLVGKDLVKKKDEGKEDTSEAKEEEETNLNFLEDASDIEPSEDVDPELSEEQKEALSQQRENLAEMIKSHLDLTKKENQKKKGSKKTQAEKMVLEVDESDDEVVLKTPPNVIKKYVKMGSSATPTATPKAKKMMCKAGNASPQAKKVKMTPKGGKATPQGGKTRPKVKNATPKAKKIKLSTEVAMETAKSTETSTLKTKKMRKLSEAENATPKLIKNKLEETVITEGEVTSAEKVISGPKTTLQTHGKATPKKASTPKLKKQTAQSNDQDIPATESLPTPEIRLKTPKSKTKSATATLNLKVSPGIRLKTPKSKTKAAMTTPDTTTTPDVQEIEVFETLATPRSKVKTPKSMKRTPKIQPSTKDTQTATPDLVTLDLPAAAMPEQTPRKGKTPKGKKRMAVTEVSSDIALDTPRSKKEKMSGGGPSEIVLANTPGSKKKKKMPDGGENKENKGNVTPKNRAVQALIPQAKTPTPSVGDDVTLSDATSGKKKKKGSHTQTHTPKDTPGKRQQDSTTPLLNTATPLTTTTTPGKKKQRDATPLTNTITPGKKKKNSTKSTPGKHVVDTINGEMTTPNTITTTTTTTKKAVLTPLKATPGKKTPKVTPKVTPSKRKSMLEVTPIGKSPKKKQKGPAAGT